jgi:hypothetical protein
MNGFGEIRPLPRWAALPGDPPALRRWLAMQAGPAEGELPEDWPQEDP